MIIRHSGTQQGVTQMGETQRDRRGNRRKGEGGNQTGWEGGGALPLTERKGGNRTRGSDLDGGKVEGGE